MSFVTTFDLSYLLYHVYTCICRRALIVFCHANCMHIEHCIVSKIHFYKIPRVSVGSES